MPNTKNQAQLEQLTEKVKRAKSLVVTTYSGLSVGEQTELQREIREAGGEFTIAKNTILRLATGIQELAEHLTQQSAILFSYEDEISPIKKLVEFIKKSEKPVIKAGVMEGKVLSVEEVESLAKLPGKLELISMVLSRIQAPAQGLVRVVQAPVRDLVYVLDAVKAQKESAK